MKKLFLVFGFVLCALLLNAQDKIISKYGSAGVTNSSAVLKTAAYNYTFLINVDAPYLYSYTIRQNDEGGAPANNTSTAYFQGSVDGTNYTNIDTVSYDGSSTYAITSGDSWDGFSHSAYAGYHKPIMYKYLRFNITPSDTIWIKSIWLNILPLK
jgi:hypothetical protein